MPKVLKFLIPLSLIFLFCCKEEKPKPKVKSVTILSTKYPHQVFDEKKWREIFANKDTLFFIAYQEFDKKGNLIRDKFVGTCISRDDHMVLNYDKNEKLLSIYTFYEEDHKNHSTDTFIYDDNDKLIKRVSILKSGDTASVEKFKYDNRGNLIKKSSNNRNLETFEVYKYDDSNNPIEELGDFHRRIKYYNKDNQLIKDVLFYGGSYGSDTVSKKVYTYDELGNLFHVVDYSAKDTLVEKFSYNEKNLIAERTYDGVKFIYKYEYYQNEK